MSTQSPNRQSFMVLILILLLVATVSTATAGKEEAVRKEVDSRVTSEGRAVSIKSAASELTIRSGSDDVVHVRADLEFWSNVDEWNEIAKRDFDVEIREDANTISITVWDTAGGGQSIRRRNGIRCRGAGAGGAVNVRNESGAVSVVGLTGEAPGTWVTYPLRGLHGRRPGPDQPPRPER